jgi:hypothetical protein
VTVVLALVSIALAPASQAEPGPRFRLAVDRHAVHAGERLTATATATTDCTWLLEWNGERRSQVSRTLATSFVAPAVSRPTRITLHGTCFHHGTRPAGSSARGNLAAFVPPSWTHTEVVTVLPPGAVVSPPHASGGPGHPGALPGTGGPALLTVLAGLVLVATGSVLVRRSSPGAVTA